VLSLVTIFDKPVFNPVNMLGTYSIGTMTLSASSMPALSHKRGGPVRCDAYVPRILGRGARILQGRSPVCTNNYSKTPSRAVVTSITLGRSVHNLGLAHATPSLRKKTSTTVCGAKGGKRNSDSGCVYVEVQDDGSDLWRLDPVLRLVQNGGVGIIPTDSLYAFVCDINNAKAVDLMYQIKDLNPSKPLSILCRTFSDIDYYTTGFPMNGSAGTTSVFKLAKQSLPGPFTLILPASKNVPARCFKKKNGDKTCKSRREVGVRMPDDLICQEILSRLDAALLCTSVRADDASPWMLEPSFMVDEYGKRGLSFVVDSGTRPAAPSTVIDITQGDPIVVRAGKGDCTIWEGVHLEESVSELAKVYAETEEEAYSS